MVELSNSCAAAHKEPNAQRRCRDTGKQLAEMIEHSVRRKLFIRPRIIERLQRITDDNMVGERADRRSHGCHYTSFLSSGLDIKLAPKCGKRYNIFNRVESSICWLTSSNPRKSTNAVNCSSYLGSIYPAYATGFSHATERHLMPYSQHHWQPLVRINELPKLIRHTDAPFCGRPAP